MKVKLFNLLAVIALSLTLVMLYEVTSSHAAAATKPIELRAVAAWPTHVTQDYWYHEFIKEVNNRAKKENIPVSIKGLGGPEVVGTYQQFAAMRSGSVDMAYNSGDYNIGEVVEASVMSCIRPDPVYHYWTLRETKVLDVVNEALRQKSGCIALFPALVGQGFTLLSTKLFKPGDWSGLKIRIAGGASVVGVPGMGGSPVTIGAAEVFEALQRGTIDAVIGTPSDRYAFGERGVYKYILKPHFYFGNTFWLISAKVWDGLPENIKVFLKGVGNDMEKLVYPWCRKWDDETIIKYIDEEKVKLLWCSPEEERKIAKVYRADFLDFIVKKSPTYGPRLYELMKDRIY